jgi:YD repeat-containing protein
MPILADKLVTTYTYDPLIGVTSITPPSGIRESYIYDSANRLQKVIDVNGKVLKEMKYNYKN